MFADGTKVLAVFAISPTICARIQLWQLFQYFYASNSD